MPNPTATHTPTRFVVVVPMDITKPDQPMVLHSMCSCEDDQCGYSATVRASDLRWNHDPDTSAWF